MRRTNVILRTIQSVLALAVLFAGSPDAIAPAALGVLAAVVIGGRMGLRFGPHPLTPSPFGGGGTQGEF